MSVRERELKRNERREEGEGKRTVIVLDSLFTEAESDAFDVSLNLASGKGKRERGPKGSLIRHQLIKRKQLTGSMFLYAACIRSRRVLPCRRDNHIVHPG